MDDKLDLHIVHSFLQRLATPFTKWQAYKDGIIDKDGNILKNRADMSDEEREGWSNVDILVANIKRLLTRVPEARQKMTSIVLALYFMREVQGNKAISSETSLKRANGQIPKWAKLNKHVQEEAVPANAVGGGHVASLGVGPAGEPPGLTKTKTKMLRRLDTANGKRKAAEKGSNVV